MVCLKEQFKSRTRIDRFNIKKRRILCLWFMAGNIQKRKWNLHFSGQHKT